ncbi:unnamed protein product [Pleuronectes platessa]|uniref:Uncharacterized protein n=1 Tax=Pleuronectes platessa TaxID=8262 RepID=A0A9N7TGY7_PLEPL|nr:unnamed protein product [Pleuronectes platessa]
MEVEGHDVAIMAGGGGGGQGQWNTENNNIRGVCSQGDFTQKDDPESTLFEMHRGFQAPELPLIRLLWKKKEISSSGCLLRVRKVGVLQESTPTRRTRSPLNRLL